MNLVIEPSQSKSFQEKLLPFLSEYKIPLLLTSIAVALIITGVVVWLNGLEKPKVQFVDTVVPSAQIVTAISGEVENPGVYTLDSSSRIHDLLVASGGLKSSADRVWLDKYINLAQKLTDGIKIYIPRTGEKPVAINNTTNVLGVTLEGSLNINTASSSQLEALPGIGPVSAEKIINNRPFATIDELVSKKVINKSVFEKIKEKITVY